jgi:hypothetical protein
MKTAAQVARYQSKARAVVEAWGALFGMSPSLRALVRVMAVAEFESRMGDARGWKDEHNWGAIQKRSLSAVERSVLASSGVAATGGEAALAVARRLVPAGPNEALHLDTSPKSGPYFAWFWAFASDAEAARKFLQVLVVQRPAVRAVLEHDDVRELARAMYETGYYEGFHKDDKDANVRDYARRIAELEPVIWAAFSSELPPHCQTCSEPPPPHEPTTMRTPVVQPSRSATRAASLLLGVVGLLMFTFAGRGER